MLFLDGVGLGKNQQSSGSLKNSLAAMFQFRKSNPLYLLFFSSKYKELINATMVTEVTPLWVKKDFSTPEPLEYMKPKQNKAKLNLVNGNNSNPLFFSFVNTPLLHYEYLPLPTMKE